MGESSARPEFLTRTFCILPWIHAHIGQAGQVMPCCQAWNDKFVSEDGSEPSIRDRSIQEVWNSTPFRELRKKMLAGEEIDVCQTCYREEALGGQSHRVLKNRDWLERHPERDVWIRRVEGSRSRDGVVEELPVYYDLRPGNLCNLKCRMCSSEWSSLIARDPVHSRWSANPHEQWLSGEEPGAWVSDPERVFEDILRRPEEVREIYLAGGETLLVPGVRAVLKRLVETGASRRMKLAFHSNLTVLPQELLDDFAFFDRVLVAASIDGHGAEYEYIRYPARWGVVSSNFEKLRNHPRVELVGQPTLQAYNILGISRLLEYFDELGVRYHLNILFHPEFLRMSLLPADARKLAADRLASYRDRSEQVAARPDLGERIGQVIEELRREMDGEARKQLARTFVVFTNDLDRSRRQSVSRALPELVRHVEADLGSWSSETHFAV